MSINTLQRREDNQKPKNERFLRLPEVMRRSGLPRASIYEQMAQGNFTKPVPLTLRTRGWIESEVEEWRQARIRARNGK